MKPTKEKQTKVKKRLTFTYTSASAPTPPRVTLKYSAPRDLPNGTGPRPPNDGQPRKQPPQALSRAINDLIRKVAQKDVQKIFAQPVTEDIAPNYFSMIKNPMDLSTIKAKFHDDEYQTLQQFKDDMRLMFENCMCYNPRNSFVYNEGSAIWQFFKKQLKLAKAQLRGETGQALSSYARTLSAGAAPRTLSALDGVDVPVVIEEAPRAEPPQPPLHRAGDPPRFHHSAAAPSAPDARFGAFCALVAGAADLQSGLRALRARFGDAILDDAVRRCAGLSAEQPIDRDALDAALSADAERSGAVGVCEAPVAIECVEALARELPELPFGCARALRAPEDDLLERNLRLELFYNNCMRHWHDTDGVSWAKQKVLRAVQENVAEIAERMPPSKMIDIQLANSHEKSTFDVVIRSIS